jgi:asparagine synthase (glutamine-hydrolysing)
MCGVLGVLGAHVSPARFDEALDELKHRGPDASGVYFDDGVALGHRRLAIIDLRSSAKQPMAMPGRDLVLVFNGEIYNYLELRKELIGCGYSFQTESDTEVLLAAYSEWGSECLRRLNGMWAFAVWDRRSRNLFVARDRFGVKPLYYVFDGKRFAFASEPKALLSLYPEYRRVDSVALYGFLARGSLYGNERAFYHEIKVFPPAHYGCFGVADGKLSIVRYWDYPRVDSYGNEACDDAVEEFESIFIDAVKVRLRSDVEVGLTLSGGLDSTSILVAASNISETPIKCFTSVYGGMDIGEATWAQRAASKSRNPLIHAEALRENWFDTLAKVAWHMDGPGYSPAVFPLWNLMARARSMGVKVVLEGQGADELLAGYVQYAVLNYFRLAQRALLRPSRARIEDAANSWRGMTLTYSAKKVVLNLIRESAPWLAPVYRHARGTLGVLRREFVESASGASSSLVPRGVVYDDPTNERLRRDHSETILPGLLQYGDAVSMAHGIESRHPFLDYRLVEWGFKQAPSFKLSQGQTKWFIRNYLRESGWPEFGNRWDKQGYPTPTGDWMKMDNGRILRETLLNANARVNEYCNRSGIERLINRYIGGSGGAENHLYRLISTEFWLKASV